MTDFETGFADIESILKWEHAVFAVKATDPTTIAHYAMFESEPTKEDIQEFLYELNITESYGLMGERLIAHIAPASLIETFRDDIRLQYADYLKGRH